MASDIQQSSLKSLFIFEMRELILKRVRVCGLIVISLNSSFVLLDRLTCPANTLELLAIIRVVSTGISVLILALSYLPVLRNITTAIGIILLVNVGCAISLMTQVLQGYESSYYAGLNLIFLGMGLMLPWKLSDALLTGALIYASYLTPIFILQKVTNWAIFINNNLFLSSSLLISLIATYVSHQYRWREFQRKFSLEKSNRDLAQAKKKLESSYQKLQEMGRLKTQFFANISHELRTPLTLILSPAESLLQDETKKSDSPFLKGLEVIHDNALRLLKLINHLLDLMKIDARRFDLHIRKVNLNSFIDTIQNAIMPLAQQKALDLSFKTEGLLEAAFDPDQIEKTLLNLIYNAIKFTDKGGQIKVHVQKVFKEIESNPSETQKKNGPLIHD